MSWRIRSSVQAGIPLRMRLRFFHQNSWQSQLEVQQKEKRQMRDRRRLEKLKAEDEEPEIALPVVGYGDADSTRGVVGEPVFKTASLNPLNLKVLLQKQWLLADLSYSGVESQVFIHCPTKIDTSSEEKDIVPPCFYDESRFTYACDSAAYHRLRQAPPTSPLGMWVWERLHQGRMLLVTPHGDGVIRPAQAEGCPQGIRMVVHEARSCKKGCMSPKPSTNPGMQPTDGNGKQRQEEEEAEEAFASSWRHRKLRPGYDTAITKTEIDTVCRFLGHWPASRQTPSLRNALVQFLIANSASTWRRDYHRLLIYITGESTFADCILPGQLPKLATALSAIGFRATLKDGQIDGVMQVWDCEDSDPQPKAIHTKGIDLLGGRRRPKRPICWFDARLDLQPWDKFPVNPCFWNALYTRWWSFWDKEHILYRHAQKNYPPRIDDGGLLYVCDGCAYSVLSHAATSTRPSYNAKDLARWARRLLNEGRLFVEHPIKAPLPWKTWPQRDLEEAREGIKELLIEDIEKQWSGCLDILWHGNKEDLKRYACTIHCLMNYEITRNDVVYVIGDRQFVKTVLKSPTRREALYRAAGHVLVHNLKQVYDCSTEPRDIDISGFSDLDVEESTLSTLPDMRTLD